MKITRIFLFSIFVVSFITSCGNSSTGLQGPKGDTGATGPKGDTGATGPAGSGYQPMASGTRLQVIQDTWVASDGAKYSPEGYSFHDTTLGIDCSPVIASDGQMRCLPIQIQLSSVQYYEDSACTVLIGVYVTPCGLPSAYGALYSTVCGAGYKIYQLGSGVATVYANYGTCQTISKSSTLSYVHIGSETPPNNFVAFTKQ
jgi:hypothetical protein